MKIKTLLSLVILFFAVVFIACDDDLSTIGQSIQPGGDDISAKGDTITTITAATVSFKDSIYARSEYGLLGEYIDPIFGKVKSDYMTELFCPEDIEFKNPNNKKLTIDSVFLSLQFTAFTGDTVAPMGLSVYEVTKSLEPVFFTNADPLKYTDNMSKLLGQSIFSIQDLNDTVISSIHVKTIKTQLNLELGQRFYNQWVTNKGTFDNSDSLKKFFKGIYVTTTFGSGSMINAAYTDLKIHYTYQGRNVANTADSTRTDSVLFSATPEVIQMNHVKNTLPDDMLGASDVKTYLKTPAGVYTQLTIPLADIVKATGKDRVINAANFKIKGYTEEEEKSKLSRPSYVLFINKDSLPNYFYNKEYSTTSKTAFVVARNSTTNTYDLGNLASVINFYTEKYKDAETFPNLEYLIIPIAASTTTSSSNVVTITDVYNLMNPTSAILRTNKENLKMTIVSSKY